MLGTRATDPNAKGQQDFAPSSDWMPPFMRVNPVIYWSYADVWEFLQRFELPICCLYERGYTSLGKRSDTQPNPALLRPGRIDRKIEFPLPDAKTKRHIFKICTGKMTLADDVNLEEFVMQKSELAGADIKAVCTEAGLLALRERRIHVTQEDFEMAVAKVMKKDTDADMSLKKLWK